MSRGTMTMRAEVSRDTSRPDTSWGQPEPPVPVYSHTLPCRAWSKVRREIRDDGKEAIVEDLRAVVPKGADILEDDRLVIKNRRGVVLFEGPIAVRTITRRGGAGSRGGHLELMLTRHV